MLCNGGRGANQYRLTLVGILMAILIGSCGGDDNPVDPTKPATILERLQALPGVEVIEIAGPSHSERLFQIDLVQPLDHDQPEGVTFRQRIYLAHVSDTLPVCFVTTGYSASPTTVAEQVQQYGWNQVLVAHRFHAGAKPNPLVWEYLTVTQAAADYHAIVELLKPLYSGPWLGTGRSRGGVVALCHRRFYPDDVAATIAYGAPIVLGLSDTRYLDWLNEQGDSECRERLWRFQRLALENRDSLLPLIDAYYGSIGSAPCCDANIVMEWLITEYRYTFWQGNAFDCFAVPDSTASAQEIWDHLIAVCWHAFMYTVDNKRLFEVFHYEILTELGGIAFDDEYISDLLLDVDATAVALLGPEGVEMVYRPEVMQDLNQWLQTEGNNIIYIYGGDSYTAATAIESIGQTNAVKIVHPTADNGVLVSDLTEAEQALVSSSLTEWLGLELD